MAHLFQSFYLHSHLPSDLMRVIITPILKKKGLDGTKSTFYRPVALATASSKVLEHIILGFCEKELQTGPWQFGYKKSHGTELAVFSVKK